jgi:myo-inositol-1(or 4)-monophosphatase
MTKEMAVAKEAAKAAGKLLMKHYKNTRKLTFKNSWDFATKADFEAEKLVISHIKKTFPKHSILSEEIGKIKGNEYKWIIDPLDGTHNFIFDIPLFGVGIALEYKKEVILSVIYLPYFNEMYTAERGKGAFLNGKKLKMSDKKGSFMITFSGVWNINDTFVKKQFNRVVKKFRHNFRLTGSAVINIAWLATGKTTGSLMLNLKPWDIGPALIVEEAGGVVTGIGGEKWDPYMKHYALGTKKMHNKILKTIK